MTFFFFFFFFFAFQFLGGGAEAPWAPPPRHAPVITRKNSTYASNFMVSDFISDHRVLHVSLKCMSSHAVRKLINFRSLTRINEGSLVLDLDNIDISSECTDVNVLVKQYYSISLFRT